MKQPDGFLTNTTTTTGRTLGAATNNPGDNTGTGMDKEIYNDPAYAVLAVVESYKDGGNSEADETLLASDMRDAIEEMVGKKVTDTTTPANSVSEYNIATSYTTVGEHVMRYGMQYVAYNVIGNVGQDPASQEGRAYWRKVPNLDALMDAWDSGKPFDNGLNAMSDRAGTNYQQFIDFGRYRMGGNGDTFKQFSLIHLDGTQVTGDADLVALLDVGGSDEYWNLDIIAPDVLGTRTLIDMGGRVVECQTDASGYVPVRGAVHGDYMQDHDHVTVVRASATQSDFVLSSDSYTGISGAASNGVTALTKKASHIDANATVPKTNDDRTAHAALVGSISGIIVCNDL